MKLMLKHFIKLDEPYIESNFVTDLEKHFSDIKVPLLENVQFLPIDVAADSSKLFGKTKFKNVSFSFTKFQDVTFSDTKFEDCFVFIFRISSLSFLRLSVHQL